MTSTCLKAAFLLVAVLVQQVTSATIPSVNPSNQTLTWPHGGTSFAVPDRDDMSLIFNDLPPSLDVGSGISSIDIHNSAQTYIKQLQLKADNPFRGLNFPIGDQASGELDCRVTGTVYRVRPIKIGGRDWNFSIKDTIDALQGVDSVARKDMGLEESDVDVIVKGKRVASVRILNQFRGTEPTDEKCLSYHPNDNVQVTAVA